MTKTNTSHIQAGHCPAYVTATRSIRTMAQVRALPAAKQQTIPSCGLKDEPRERKSVEALPAEKSETRRSEWK